MPLFISDEDLDRCGDNVMLIAEKADFFIRDLQRQLQECTSKADAAAITFEQSCSIVEQKYVAISEQFAELEARNKQLQELLDKNQIELAEVKAEKHQLHLKAINKDGEVESISLQLAELRKSKRKTLELLEQRDVELSEKNSLIKSYLEKIVHLTDDANLKDAKLHDAEAEMARSQAMHSRVSQEKELLERHNKWLNEELTSKANSLQEQRRSADENEAQLSSKLADVTKQLDEYKSSSNKSKGRLKELEEKLLHSEEEICSTKSTASSNEERFSAELAMTTKLVELYKESAEERSKKATELEGVIRALETHLSQVEVESKEQVQKLLNENHDLEKVVTELKEKLSRCELELESARKRSQTDLLALISAPSMPVGDALWLPDDNVTSPHREEKALVPTLPSGISGTALAAALLKDGWSLAKMYGKYQEAVDALRHEQLGRRHSEAILERVLKEIEEKAEFILDERAEHEKMVEAYILLDQKLEKSLSDQTKFENIIRELKVELRRSDRELGVSQKDIEYLEKQVAVLLKECQDIQVRCGASVNSLPAMDVEQRFVGLHDGAVADGFNPERLLPFKDIIGTVQQNVQLRSLVHSLTLQKEQRELELKEALNLELKKHTEAATAKVTAVLERCEEQGRMIESLHSSVAMYKRLYEEQLKRHKLPYDYQDRGLLPEIRPKDLLPAISEEESKNGQLQVVQHTKKLEEELDNARSQVSSMRIERDKVALEASFARDRLDRLVSELEEQRSEANAVLARNVEFSQLIVDYQRRLRESAQTVQSSEELSRKLSMEVSILKCERDIVVNSEKRAVTEIQVLSERIHRLQASLDTFQCAEEIKENARANERRKLEEDLQKAQREWAEAKQELQEERAHGKNLMADRDQTIKSSMQQIEEMQKELTSALRSVASAEARAVLSESRCVDLELKLKHLKSNVNGVPMESNQGAISYNDVSFDLSKVHAENETLKEEVQSLREHMLQFKKIAEVNEDALKQMECAHNAFKTEAEKIRSSMELEVNSLRCRITELEDEIAVKAFEFNSKIAEKEDAVSSGLSDIARLMEDNLQLKSQREQFESCVSSLKQDLENEHQKWRTAHHNYERQVILQSETIQELKRTSEALALLQHEYGDLKKQADELLAENSIIKETWEKEKTQLQRVKDEAETRNEEINQQNVILLNRLEAIHNQYAVEGISGFEISSSSAGIKKQGDADLQTVISYLRRSKEIAETESSLLRQERLRLRTQLESALKASETARNLLQAERESSKKLIYNDEEFKALQFQVREINLLRESNVQLREENKHNFDECQKLSEKAQKERADVEHLSTLLREKDIELEACRKQNEMQDEEIRQLSSRLLEWKERYKTVDLEGYNQMKNRFQEMEDKLMILNSEIENTQGLVTQKDATIQHLEVQVSTKENTIVDMEKKLQNYATEIASKDQRISELEKRPQNNIQDADAHKAKDERSSFASLFPKRRFGATSTAGRDELLKEKEAPPKQLEEYRTGKLSDEAAKKAAQHEQALKEKDTRIQILEKTLEREREDHKKEKAGRQKDQKSFLAQAEKLAQEKRTLVEDSKKLSEEKKKLIEELEQQKRAKDVPMGKVNTLVTEAKPAVDADMQVDHNVQKAGQSRTSLSYPVPIPTVSPSRLKSSVEKDTKPLGVKPATEPRRKRLIRPDLHSSEPVAPREHQSVRPKVFTAPEVLPQISKLPQKEPEEREPATHTEPHAEASEPAALEEVSTDDPVVMTEKERQADQSEPTRLMETETEGSNLAGGNPESMEDPDQLVVPARKRAASPLAEVQEDDLDQRLDNPDEVPLAKKAKVSDTAQGQEPNEANPEAADDLFFEELNDVVDLGPADGDIGTADGVKDDEMEKQTEPSEFPEEVADVLESADNDIEEIDEAVSEQPGDEGEPNDDADVDLPAAELDEDREEGELVSDMVADIVDDVGSPLEPSAAALSDAGADVGPEEGENEEGTDGTSGQVEMSSAETLAEEVKVPSAVSESGTPEGKAAEAAEGDLTTSRGVGFSDPLSSTTTDEPPQKEAGTSSATEMTERQEPNTQTRKINLRERARRGAMERQSGIEKREPVFSPLISRGHGRGSRGFKKDNTGGRGRSPSQ